MNRQGVFESINYALLYEDFNTVFHNLDPRSKLLYIVLTIVISMAINNLTTLISILITNIMLLALHRTFLKKFISLLKGLSLFISIIIIFNIVITLAFTEMSIVDIVSTQIKSIARVLNLIIAILILLTTTTPWQIIQAFTKIKIRYTYIYPFIIALRFIPIIFSEMKNIYDAQRARGIEFEKGSILNRIRKSIAIIIPTVVCSIIRAKDLIEAMELRGFGYRNERTFYKPIQFRKIDILFITIITTIYLAIILLSTSILNLF